MAYTPSRASQNKSESIPTTDATVTTLLTIPIRLASSIRVVGRVTGQRTGGASGTAGDMGSYFFTFAGKNAAGTAVLGNLVMIDAYEDQPAWDVTITTSGGSALIQVTGAASNNITWQGNFEITQNV